MRDAKTAVVIPARNEADNIAQVLADIPEGPRIVVVDNGSQDATAARARAAGADVVAEPIAGYGRACLAGIAALADAPPDIVVFLDADYSDDPTQMPALTAPILAGAADLVIGSRRLGHCAPGAMTPVQRFGNWLAPTLIRLIWGASFTDLGPFRAIRYDALRALDMRDQDFGWTVEMQVKAAQRSLRCVETAVDYRRRLTGRSQISGTLRGAARAGFKILWVILRASLGGARQRRSPVRHGSP